MLLTVTYGGSCRHGGWNVPGKTADGAGNGFSGVGLPEFHRAGRVF